VYLELQKRLGERIFARVLKEKYDLELENIPLEIPPDLKFGELSTPIAFELARKLRKAPKIIAQEIVPRSAISMGFARWWSTPASIPTRPRTSAICATPSWATRLCACCAPKRAKGRRAELHRQHRRAGGRCGRRLSASRRQIARRRSARCSPN
jgi:hypothetical protein